MLFDFEHHHHPLISRSAFFRRVSIFTLVGLCLIGISLALGMLGYHVFEQLGWLDSFLNASMIMSGMGPLWSPQSDAGKLFAGLYALYSGLALLVFVGITFAPLIHRLLHVFHTGRDTNQPPTSGNAS